ncbi:unnamed protein product, partial [Polarella glacialis]
MMAEREARFPADNNNKAVGQLPAAAVSGVLSLQQSSPSLGGAPAEAYRAETRRLGRVQSRLAEELQPLVDEVRAGIDHVVGDSKSILTMLLADTVGFQTAPPAAPALVAAATKGPSPATVRNGNFPAGCPACLAATKQKRCSWPRGEQISLARSTAGTTSNALASSDAKSPPKICIAAAFGFGPRTTFTKTAV